MARKAWQDLTPAYRARLERQGITEAQHASGASIHKARGHKSQTHEKQQRQKLKAQRQKVVNDWAKDFARLYGRPASEVQREVKAHGQERTYRAIRHQERMQSLYDSGRTDEAARLWDMRDRSLPDWMFFYHGYFN